MRWGICLNWGCIPTKALLRNAEIYHLMQHGADFGLYCDNLRFDFSRVIARSRQVAERLSQGVAFLMRKNKIQVLRGTGRLAGAGAVTVHDAQGTPTTTLRAAHILLATGARSRPLPGLPFDQTRVLSSTEAMVLQEVPRALVIIGAGAVGVEFAYFYNTFGTQVTLVEMLPQILPIEDSEIAGLLQKSLEKQGIAIHVGSRVEQAEITADGVQVQMHTPRERARCRAHTCSWPSGCRGTSRTSGSRRRAYTVSAALSPSMRTAVRTCPASTLLAMSMVRRAWRTWPPPKALPPSKPLLDSIIPV